MLITTPASGGIKTIVHGVNNKLIGDDVIYCTASCTTGAIAPVLTVLEKEFGILSGSLTKSIGNLVKVVAWYDNEVGISNRIAELVSLL